MELKLGHYGRDGAEVVDVEGGIDISTAPRLRELLIELVSQGNYRLVVNLDKVGFVDSTGLGVLVVGLNRVRAHDGWLDLVCTRERVLTIFKITGLTKVFGIYQCGPGHCGREGRPVRTVSPGGGVAGGFGAIGGGAHRDCRETVPARSPGHAGFATPSAIMSLTGSRRAGTAPGLRRWPQERPAGSRTASRPRAR